MFALLKCRYQSRIVILYSSTPYYLTEQVNLRGRVSLTSTWISAMLESTEVGRHSAPSIIVGTCVIWPSFHRSSLSPPPRMNAGSLSFYGRSISPGWKKRRAASSPLLIARETSERKKSSSWLCTSSLRYDGMRGKTRSRTARHFYNNKYLTYEKTQVNAFS